MKAIFLLCCTVLFCQFVFSQDTILKKNYYIKMRVWQTNAPTRDLYLADINDTALIVSNQPMNFRKSMMNTTAISYPQLEMATVKRRGSVGRGMLMGGLIGMIGGGIVGAATYKKCDDCIWDFGVGPNIAAGSILGTATGVLTGAIIGALAQKKFIIGGQRNKFEALRLTVLDMAYRGPKP